MKPRNWVESFQRHDTVILSNFVKTTQANKEHTKNEHGNGRRYWRNEYKHAKCMRELRGERGGGTSISGMDKIVRSGIVDITSYTTCPYYTIMISNILASIQLNCSNITKKEKR